MSADYELERVIVAGNAWGDGVNLICTDCDETGTIPNNQPVWRFTEWADEHVCPAGAGPRDLAPGHRLWDASEDFSGPVGTPSSDDALGFPLRPERSVSKVFTHHIKYEVSVFPLHEQLHAQYHVEVQRFEELWSVSRNDHWFLREDGQWDGLTNDIDTSYLELAFIRRHSYPRETALRLAREAAPKLYALNKLSTFPGLNRLLGNNPGRTAEQVLRSIGNE